MQTAFLPQLSREKRVVALGSFDGVHYAHRAVLEAAYIEALRRNVKATAFTFTEDPSAYFGHPEKKLNTFSEREEHIRACRMDEIVYADFDKTMRERTPGDFYTFLRDTLTPVSLVCGFNYTFGREAKGDTALLKSFCEKDGLSLTVVPPVILGGFTVSSTCIRHLIETGEIAAADRLLGYPYRLEGKVLHGEGNGRIFGFPTANIPLDPARATPAYGVYLSLVAVGETTYRAVTDIGIKPTVSEKKEPTAESFLLDFSGNLYGQTVSVSLLQFLRSERKFASREALVSQIGEDVKSARLFFDE